MAHEEEPDKNDTIMVSTKFSGGYDGELSITINELLRLVKHGKVTVNRHEHRKLTLKFLGTEDES